MGTITEDQAIEYYNKQLLLRVLGFWIRFTEQEVQDNADNDIFADDLFRYKCRSKALVRWKLFIKINLYNLYNERLSLVYARLVFGRKLLNRLKPAGKAHDKERDFMRNTKEELYNHITSKGNADKLKHFFHILRTRLSRKRRGNRKLLQNPSLNTFLIFPTLRDHVIQQTYYQNRLQYAYKHYIRSLKRRGLARLRTKEESTRATASTFTLCTSYYHHYSKIKAVSHFKGMLTFKYALILMNKKAIDLNTTIKRRSAIRKWGGFIAELYFYINKNRKCALHSQQQVHRRVLKKLVQCIKYRYAAQKTDVYVDSFRSVVIMPWRKRSMMKTWLSYTNESKHQYATEHYGHNFHLHYLVFKGLQGLKRYCKSRQRQSALVWRGQIENNLKLEFSSVSQLERTALLTKRKKHSARKALCFYCLFRFLKAIRLWLRFVQDAKDKRMLIYEAKRVRRSLLVKDVCRRIVTYAIDDKPGEIRRFYLAKKYARIWRDKAKKWSIGSTRNESASGLDRTSILYTASPQPALESKETPSNIVKAKDSNVYAKAKPRLTAFLELLKPSDEPKNRDKQGEDDEPSLSDTILLPSMVPTIQRFVELSQPRPNDLARAPPRQSLLLAELGQSTVALSENPMLSSDRKEAKKQLKKALAVEILKFVQEYKDVLVVSE